jgi:23S rRNA (uracil1939-C5)-methyltransferase
LTSASTCLLDIESLDLEGQGVGHLPDGRVVFVEGALPQERVCITLGKSKNSWVKGHLVAIHKASPFRVQPACPHFGLHAGACGGCKTQHLDSRAQLAVKARALEDALWHLGRVRPQIISPPIEGPIWGYRHRARLSLRYVEKKGKVCIGFHERNSHYVADLSTCPVLPPAVSQLLPPLARLLESLEAKRTCPQIELAQGDCVLALVLRHLEPLSEADLMALRAFAQAYQGLKLQWWLQAKGPDSVVRLDEDNGGLDDHPSSEASDLAYGLSEFDLRMPFLPTDFTQINPAMNAVLVRCTLRALAVQPHERVIDWFCGLGNFTLPLATQAQHVLGLEGSGTLVARAQANATAFAQQRHARGQGMATTQFEARNLFEWTEADLLALGPADKWLIDPPREGALAVVKTLSDLHQKCLLDPQTLGHDCFPKRIVYVSCHPATLARDAGLLVHQAGYRCVQAGVFNMFAHTAHVESLAVFERV